MTANCRDRLVDAAVLLFDRDGIHATGIERILAEAQVAKMTLYKHFKSKDELVLAALRRSDERFRNWFMRTVEKAGPDPRKRLLAAFDALEAWCGRADFRGCLFVNASAELGRDAEPVRRAAAEHKRLLLAFLGRLARDAGAENPEAIAEQVLILMEGATSLALVMGRAEAARQARQVAEVLLDRMLPVDGERPATAALAGPAGSV